MKATEILMDEHRVIERVLAAMDKAVSRLNAGEPVRPAFFLEAADFIKGFADGCHHKKEEGVLFPALVAGGMSAQSGPVAVMLYEHQEGRRLTLAMKQAAERLQNGEAAAREDVVNNAQSYVLLLRQHILKEDNVLFPMAERVIPPDQQPGITEAFERIEHEETGEGVHDKYLSLAERLEQEIADYASDVSSLTWR